MIKTDHPISFLRIIHHVHNRALYRKFVYLNHFTCICPEAQGAGAVKCMLSFCSLGLMPFVVCRFSIYCPFACDRACLVQQYMIRTTIIFPVPPTSCKRPQPHFLSFLEGPCYQTQTNRQLLFRPERLPFLSAATGNAQTPLPEWLHPRRFE